MAASKKKPQKKPQPHGGAIYAAGVEGNRGGGRPPSAIRARCRESFSERIRVAEEIADDPEQPTRERLRALAILGRFGGLDSPVSDADARRERVPDPEILALARAVRLPPLAEADDHR